MKVLIVRHAIAYSSDPSQWPDDRQRPLSSDGERKLRRAAKGLMKVEGKVDVVLSSPWTRAWQTAEILHEVAGWPAPTGCEALEGNRSPRGVVAVLKTYKHVQAVALVGHQPQVEGLVSYLLTGDAARVMLGFKKAGVALLELDPALRAGTARLVWYLPPKMLRALG